MVLFPGCKINLGLNVINRRSDGFHDIETVFFPVPLHDALEIIPAADGFFSFSLAGIHIPGYPEDNLCVKAFRMVQARFGLPEVNIHLYKGIPAGSGLGGGSSDGASALKLLNEVFGLSLKPDELEEMARTLGSDCAFFIREEPCFAFGKGDRFEAVRPDLSLYSIVLVVPGIHVSTAEAYAGVVPSRPEVAVKEIIRLPVEMWKDRLKNDFEPHVFAIHPELALVKDKLYGMGAVYAAMSGSGSAVFGLFRRPPAMEGMFPGCFTWVS